MFSAHADKGPADIPGLTLQERDNSEQCLSKNMKWRVSGSVQSVVLPGELSQGQVSTFH